MALQDGDHVSLCRSAMARIDSVNQEFAQILIMKQCLLMPNFGLAALKNAFKQF
jgi:hypothetical protein